MKNDLALGLRALRLEDFREFVETALQSEPTITHEWSEDQTTVVFKKSMDTGFDVSVRYCQEDEILWLDTDCSFHEHFHIDKFTNRKDVLGLAFGLVRDLLSCHMRVEQTLVNGQVMGWRLQAFRNGEWKTESKGGRIFWNFWVKRTTNTVTYSNETLPPRDFP